MAIFNPMTLTDKRILVTGASSGIGRACALYASRLGARVILSGRRLDALEKTRLDMENSSTHTVVAGDLSEVAFATALVEQAVMDGKLDGFVHAAGICPALPIGVIATEQLTESMQVNYFAFLLLMKAFAKKKHVNPGFSAVAISSVSAAAGWPAGTLYAGSKGALSAAVRALAIELAPKGTRVNAVCPSNIHTPMFDALAGSGLNDDAALAKLKEKQPLGIGEPEQVAAAVCFLLSSASSFITGVNLPVDGGYLAQ
ncbi:MAG: SDR family oxidoreductase [Lentisphaerae bacterium]|jgi:NAD(P)-dependent dehydrogenase (short-subunit alcohol dehydrogenase family)|nr:SDR family oxidoreductase [Lentisphaerota bacterium]